MPKKLFKRLIPDHRTIREHKYLRIFGRLLHDPNLFHFNRRSVSGAVANGLFWALIPMPFQMLPSALCAIFFRINLPLSVVLVWLTNPITVPPVFYFCYKVGSWLLDTPPHAMAARLSTEWLGTELAIIWKPFLLGSLVVAVTSSLLGYLAVRLLWRIHLIRYIQRKRRERELRKVFRDHNE